MRSKAHQLAPLVIAVLSGAGLAAGCGEVHSIPISQDAMEIAQTVCSSAYRCCSLSQLMNNNNAGTDAGAGVDCTADPTPCEHECESETAQSFRAQLSTVQASVDAKRAVFEQAKVDACLQTIRSSTCDALNMTNHLMGVPGCDSFVTPLVPLGGACTQDYECIGGWCQLPASSATGDGMCVATAAAGQSCAVGSQSCASGLTCDLKGTTDSSDDVCVQPGGIGATCTDSAMCQSGNCSSSGGSGMMCAAPTAQMCFYGGGCSTPGPDGPPGPGTIVLLGLFAAIALIRAHRAGKAATDSGYSRDA